MNRNGEIEHTFYRKEITNKQTIMKSSAMSKSQKNENTDPRVLQEASQHKYQYP